MKASRKSSDQSCLTYFGLMVRCQVPLPTIGLKLADTCGFGFIGVIYFIFMLGEPMYTLTSVWMMSTPVFVVPGIINIIVVLQFQVCLALVIVVIAFLMRTKSGITDRCC